MSRQRVLRAGDDEGTTLLELVVAMTIMLVFLGIFTGAIVVISKSQAKTTSVSESAGNVNQAFLWLDKTVRYASAITTPGQGSSGDWYVELRNTTSGSEKCTQIRLDIVKAQLQYREWWPSGTPSTPPSTFIPQGSNLTNGNAAAGSADLPFVSPSTATTSQRFQQLQVTLLGQTGTSSARTQFTLVAINSTMPKSSAVVCQAARP